MDKDESIVSGKGGTEHDGSKSAGSVPDGVQPGRVSPQKKRSKKSAGKSGVIKEKAGLPQGARSSKDRAKAQSKSKGGSKSKRRSRRRDDTLLWVGVAAVLLVVLVLMALSGTRPAPAGDGERDGDADAGVVVEGADATAAIGEAESEAAGSGNGAVARMPERVGPVVESMDIGPVGLAGQTQGQVQGQVQEGLQGQDQTQGAEQPRALDVDLNGVDGLRPDDSRPPRLVPDAREQENLQGDAYTGGGTQTSVQGDALDGALAETSASGAAQDGVPDERVEIFGLKMGQPLVLPRCVIWKPEQLEYVPFFSEEEVAVFVQKAYDEPLEMCMRRHVGEGRVHGIAHEQVMIYFPVGSQPAMGDHIWAFGYVDLEDRLVKLLFQAKVDAQQIVMKRLRLMLGEPGRTEMDTRDTGRVNAALWDEGSFTVLYQEKGYIDREGIVTVVVKRLPLLN